MTKHKVLVACKLEEPGLKKLKARPDLDLTIIPKPTQEDLAAQAAQTEAIIIKSAGKLTAEILDKAPNLKIVCRAGAGVDNIDVKKATERGIPVTNTPGLNSNSVAELVFSYVHALYKGSIQYDRTTKEGLWEKGKYQVNELRGKRIGIAGMGAIGRKVRDKAKGYGMLVSIYDPYIAKTMAEDLDMTLAASVKELFETCDIVTLHMPATAETKGVVTKELLCSMKENAIFINTARAALLAPNALEQALTENKTLRAGIDVFPEEKAGPQKLAEFGPRVVLTPHIGGNSLEAQLDIAVMAADTVIWALTENRLVNLVNFVKIPEDLSPAYLELSEALGHIAAGVVQGKGQLEEIRITCYGKLNSYTEILVKPAIQGVMRQFVEGGITLINAEAKAKELGTRILLREPDNSKGYGQSITVDVMVRESDKALESSVRGKLIEGEPAVVRVDDFNELGIKPAGHQAFFVYEDRPGVIGSVSTLLGKQGINIESILARTDAKQQKQLLVIRTRQVIPNAVLSEIAVAVETNVGTAIQLARKYQFGA